MSKHTFKRLVLAVALTDGREYPELVVTNTAHVEWDLARARHRWPSSEDAPFLWMTYIAYQQLALDGDYEGKWAEFQKICQHVETIKDPLVADEAQTDDVDPTHAESGGGSAST